MLLLTNYSNCNPTKFVSKIKADSKDCQVYDSEIHTSNVGVAIRHELMSTGKNEQISSETIDTIDQRYFEALEDECSLGYIELSNGCDDTHNPHTSYQGDTNHEPNSIIHNEDIVEAKTGTKMSTAPNDTSDLEGFETQFTTLMAQVRLKVLCFVAHFN